jgi:hypothetical protein
MNASLIGCLAGHGTDFAIANHGLQNRYVLSAMSRRRQLFNHSSPA